MQLKHLETTWKEMLTLGSSQPEADVLPYLLKNIEQLNHQVDSYRSSFSAPCPGGYVWPELSDLSRSQVHTNHYLRLYDMAKAYALSPSRHYKDETLLSMIIQTLYFLHDEVYNAELDTYYDNWWNWEIGNPKALLNIMCLLGEDLPGELKELCCRTIFHFQPDPCYSGHLAKNTHLTHRVSVGGNRVDTSHIAILLGIVWRREELIRKGASALCETFTVREFDPAAKNEARDGFYPDGSFIQHGNTPYTGTYGNVLLKGIGMLSFLLSKTSYLPADSPIECIYESILNTFLPVLYKGHCMDCVCGRGASRQAENNNKTGHEILSSILWFGESAPADWAELFKRRIKYMLQADSLRNYLECTENLFCIQLACHLLNDDSVPAQAPSENLYSYVYMDRLIAQSKNWAAALSMSSKWIRTYETMLGENKLGFCSGDGKLSIYQDDPLEYEGSYQATINPYALPGTTVLEEKRNIGEGSVCPDTNLVTTLAFDTHTGSAMMDLKRDFGEHSLRGRKSYFFLEHGIVVLGADIQSAGCTARSIVDTRKQPDSSANRLSKEENLLHLTGRQPGITMGYCFLTPTFFDVSFYKREACWHDINDNGTAELQVQDYVTISIPHPAGTNRPDSFAYVMLPGISREELLSYARSTPVTVLYNEAQVQAIICGQYRIYHCYGAIALEEFSVSAPVALGIIESQSAENEKQIILCDPTKECASPLVLTLPGSFSCLESSIPVDVLSEADTTRLTLSWQKLKGMPAVIKLKEIKET